MTFKGHSLLFLAWIFISPTEASERQRLSPSMALQQEVNVTVDEGERAVLPCVVNNLGPHTVSWFGKGNPITIGYNVFLPKGSPVSVQHDDSHWNLVLHSTTPQDSGTYTCQVSSIVPLQHEVHLYVKANKLAERHKKPAPVEEVPKLGDAKSRARALPEAEGEEPSEKTKGDVSHQGKKHHKNKPEVVDHVLSTTDDLHALRVESVRKQHEAQMMLIDLQREYFQIEHEARMDSIRTKSERGKRRKRKQRNIRKTDSVVIQGKEAVDVGNDAEFLCRYSVEEDSTRYGTTLTWYKDGNQLFPFNESSTSLSIHEFAVPGGMTSRLRLVQTRKEDAGTYICRGPSDTVATHQLHVLSGYTSNTKREQSGGGGGHLVNGATPLLSLSALMLPIFVHMAS